MKAYEKYCKFFNKDFVLQCLNDSLSWVEFWNKLNVVPLRINRGLKEFESFFNINVVEIIKQNIKFKQQLEHDKELIKIRICKCCSKEYTWKNSLQHTEYCSRSCSNTRKHLTSTKEKISSTQKINNKLAKEAKIKLLADKILKYNESPNLCIICNNKIPYEKRNNKTCSSQCRVKYTTQILKNNGHFSKNGGYRKGACRGKSGYYQGIWCDSTYELVYLIYCLDHNINIKRNSKTFSYVYENKQHKYLPDFIIDDVFIEIKGYIHDSIYAKLQAVRDCGESINMLTYDDLQIMMDYVDKTYNTYHKRKENNYYILYDNYKKF